jgi:hypothetical protein
MNFARWSVCELRGGGNHHYCRSSVICPSKTTIYEVVTTPVCVEMIPLHAVSVRGPKEAPIIHSQIANGIPTTCGRVLCHPKMRASRTSSHSE